jgi:hypothetical protein
VNRLAGDQFVRMTFAKRPLRQRVVAVAAAYLIALSGLVTSLAEAQAAQAEATAQPDAIICHSSPADQSAPASQDDNNRLCIKSCVACITSLEMAIAPTISAVRLPQSVIKRLDLPARVVQIAGAKFNAHRSRGPPPVL